MTSRGHLTGKDLFWGYSAQLLNIGGGLFLLPFVLHYLSPEDVGLWYVFLALIGAVQLLEFGFLPTISRQSSYVYAGARILTAEGIPTVIERGTVDSELLVQLLRASRHIYRMITAGAAVFLFFGASIYLYSLVDANRFAWGVLVAWLIYASGALLNFYFGYYNGFLQGRGEITAVNKVTATSRVVMVAFSALALWADFGLIGMAVASVLSAAYTRVSLQYIFSRGHSKVVSVGSGPLQDRVHPDLLWKSAWKLGLVQVGAFLILRGNVLVASSMLGLAAAASYGLTVQLLTLLNSLASMLAMLQLPRMNALQSSRDQDELKTVFSLSLCGSWVVYIAGGAVILFLAPSILGMMKSNASLIPTKWLLLFLMVGFLEVTHSVCASYLTTLNVVPFLTSALCSGAALTALSVAASRYTPLGVGGLVLAQAVVQLAYNNWKWPVVAFNHLELTPGQVVIRGWSAAKRTLALW